MTLTSGWRALASRLAWPGRCMLCGDWGPRSLCAPCVTHWAQPCPRCARCAMPLPASARLDDAAPDDCPRCEAQHPEFDRAVAAVHYAAPWSTVVTRLKFQGQTALARPLGQLLAQAVQARWAQRVGPPPDLVMPLPVSGARLRERGFNQSWLLARHCAHALALPCRHDVLRRTLHTERLMRMSAEDRALALRDAFEVVGPRAHLVRGRHVVLVDDVLTTGATLNAASLALRAAGASTVSAWVLARTP